MQRITDVWALKLCMRMMGQITVCFWNTMEALFLLLEEISGEYPDRKAEQLPLLLNKRQEKG